MAGVPTEPREHRQETSSSNPLSPKYDESGLLLLRIKRGQTWPEFPEFPQFLRLSPVKKE